MAEMKLWILEPIDLPKGQRDPWDPWYDKAFAHVVRAQTEGEARALAGTSIGDECRGPAGNVWLDPKYTTCIELTADGTAEVVMTDFHAA
jgi:hypothetical protein